MLCCTYIFSLLYFLYSTKLVFKQRQSSQPAFICSKLTIETLEQGVKYDKMLTIKTLERHQWHRSGVFTVIFEHISRLVLVSLLLTLNM